MSEKMKRCKYCDEEIFEAAIKCKHCGSMLNEGSEFVTSKSEGNPNVAPPVV